MAEKEPLLEVKGLKTHFNTYEGVVRALQGVDFSVRAGETFGLVGESGCGKSVTALSVMGLVPDPPGEIVAGEVRFRGENLLEKSEAEMREVRGNDISMIFQEPMTALNPVYTVGDQIVEVLSLHGKVDDDGAGGGGGFFGRVLRRRRRREAAWGRAVDALAQVGIPNPDRVARSHPHELSGGMRQRVMIAMMMACAPDLLIADEPTTALDVTIEAQILELMKELQERTGMAIWMITHDLGVVAETCDNVAVMYAGYIVERADVDTIFREPRMPYTIQLLRAIPRVGVREPRLPIIPGSVPNLLDPPSGCPFHPRCPLATDVCREEVPALEAVADGHLVRCHHKDETVGGRIPEEAREDPTRGGEATRGEARA